MPFTVDAVPHLPAGFGDTFTSRTVDVNGVELHAVVGGSGPALLLLPGWPQFWYCWRLMMPALAEHFTVVAADMRGMGASSKPVGGYDAVTLADDMAGLMTSLGHDSFQVAGYDMGMMVGYVLAARHRDRVSKLVLAEAVLAGFTPMPPLLMPPEVNEQAWHFVFNRLAEINERMVSGREEIYFGYQFATKAASPEAIPQAAVDVYVDALRDPAALRASFDFYRAGESGDQVVALAAEGPLDIPVLAIGGEHAMRDGVEQAVRQVAPNTTGAIAPGAAHFVPEEAPEWMARTLIDFFVRN
ncbi:alpha/beta fold hydrolase [Streptomyces nigra]|uniref:alpha/beta fold hydrolase n=1 Tax=Streptomyces nigra TaxID=1827580 RepID=UPI00369FC672